MPDHIPLQAETSAGPSSAGLKKLGVGATIVVIVLVGYGLVSRRDATETLRTTASEAALPAVSIVRPQAGRGSDPLVLPGNVEAYNSAAIYARTNGYVRQWLADIGDRVVAGQALAVLEAPEIDQQLAQARADYNSALANRRLAQTTAERWRTMLAKDAVSKQESDERDGALAAQTATANASLANVRRLEALQGFQRLRAPFRGIVTSRSAQIGALVTSGNASAQPLFTVSDIHRMRIYVRVPQGYATQVPLGVKATMTLPEFPQRTFRATVTRSARAVDRQSGAVLVQLEADNADEALSPGAFAQVRFDVSPQDGQLRIPGSAILFGSDGPGVAVLGANDRVRLARVQIARDEGRTVVVSGGLAPTDRVIDATPDSIRTEDRVRLARSGDAAGGQAR